MGGVKVPSQVSIDDYEDVKKMWLKHYREAPTPLTEKIKSREDWLGEDVKELTNVSNLISSGNIQLKQKGLEKVSEILPFMLLGGFSDVEILTYLNAKLEAAKQIKVETEMIDKLKEDVKKEEEETLLEAPPKPTEEKKTMEEEKKMTMNIPDNEKKIIN
jgi:hypothetical protein